MQWARCGVVWTLQPSDIIMQLQTRDAAVSSLQAAGCMQTQKCGGRRQLAPTLAGVPRKALNFWRWPDWSRIVALQHCSTAALQPGATRTLACRQPGRVTRDTGPPHLTSTRCKSVIVVWPVATVATLAGHQKLVLRCVSEMWLTDNFAARRRRCAGCWVMLPCSTATNNAADRPRHCSAADTGTTAAHIIGVPPAADGMKYERHCSTLHYCSPPDRCCMRPCPCSVTRAGRAAAVLQCCRRGLLGQFKYFHRIKHKYDRTATLSHRHTTCDQSDQWIHTRS